MQSGDLVVNLHMARELWTISHATHMRKVLESVNFGVSCTVYVFTYVILPNQFV